jgi:hypothetical protein
MKTGSDDLTLDSELLPAQQWDDNAKKRALDELFTRTGQYSSSADYHSLLQFISRFKRYSTFNAMLVHIQKPGARYVLRASEWLDKYNRRIMPGAQPLVALQPMSPVMFLFDVADTEGAPLPPEIESPFEVRNGRIGKEFELTLDNCARDGIRVTSVRHGSQRAGSIQAANQQNKRSTKSSLVFRDNQIEVCYELLLNENTSAEARYATLTHELGHLYCGHVGTPNPRWWPDRRGLDITMREFEAESVSYLVCHRQGIDTPSDQYLNGYLKANDKVPPISLERVLTVAGLIERMGSKLLPLRKVG